MLICNNCNSVNEEGSSKCVHCRMEGDFRRQMGDNKSDDTPILHTKLLCRNCGSHDPGHGIKCTHCRFPLAPVNTPVKTGKSVETGLQVSAIHSSAKHP